MIIWELYDNYGCTKLTWYWGEEWPESTGLHEQLIAAQLGWA